jgi:hypothetical protein
MEEYPAMEPILLHRIPTMHLVEEVEEAFG